MELGDYARVFLKWWWLIVLGVLVAAGSTFLAVRQQPNVYQATATLMVGQVLQQQQPSDGDLRTAYNLGLTYVELAGRRVIREAAKEALGLGWLPGFEVARKGDTQLLEVRVTDTDPQRAAAVANEVAYQMVLHSPSNPEEEQVERQAFVQQQLDDLETNIAVTKAEIDDREAALAGMFSAREIADTQAQIAAMQQKLNAYQANYGQLLFFMGEGAVNTLSIVEVAVPPSAPIGPNRMRTVLLAAAVGLVLAAGTAFLLEYLDDTIKTPDEVDRVMGVNALAGISRIPGERLRDKLITAQRPRSPISESYRHLRTSLQFSSLDRPIRTMVVTSPSPVEGKSTTAANLAVVMAQEGRAVVLVDADLRRPVLHRIFQLGNKTGLTDVLVQKDLALDGHLQPTGIDNLRLLNTGPLPPNPSELLASERMDTLIEYLKAEANIIIFDSPPALTVTDALVLAAKTDGVLLVVDSGRTRRRAAEDSVQRFQQTGSHVLGVALNRFRSGRRGYYYYHYYEVDSSSRRKRRRVKD